MDKKVPSQSTDGRKLKICYLLMINMYILQVPRGVTSGQRPNKQRRNLVIRD